MKRIFHISLIVASVLAMVSCNKEYDDITSDNGFKGVFVRNEAGTVSFYNEIDSTVTSDIYNQVNNADLGTNLSALSIIGKNAYLLKGIGASQGIERLNAETFKWIESKDGFADFTDLVPVSEQFLCATQGVSGDENSGSLIVLDSLTLEPVAAPLNSNIKVGKNPTRVLYNGGKKVYVANSGGGEYIDSTVMVIDITSTEVIDTIDLKLKTPVEMVTDAYRNIWVLCTGVNNKEVGLAKIKYGTHEVEVFEFEDGYVGDGRNCLTISRDGNSIYYVKKGMDDDNNGMYEREIFPVVKPQEKFFAGTSYEDMVFDAIGINPYNGKYFCAKDGEAGANGSVYVFNRYGENKDNRKFEVGKKPRQFTFVR